MLVLVLVLQCDGLITVLCHCGPQRRTAGAAPTVLCLTLAANEPPREPPGRSCVWQQPIPRQPEMYADEQSPSKDTKRYWGHSADLYAQNEGRAHGS